MPAVTVSTAGTQAGMKMRKPIYVKEEKRAICPMPDCLMPVKQCKCYTLCYACNRLFTQ